MPATLAMLVGGLATVLLVFPLMSQARRDATVGAWSRLLLKTCGLRLVSNLPDASSAPLAARAGGRLLVANHVSWLDIFVINAVAPSCFIAKDDIAHWPVVGTLVSRVGTLFLARGSRHAVHEAVGRIGSYLESGRRIAIFPEGMVGPGDRLLPFHANLMQAAIRASVPIDPVGIDYRGLDGRPATGESGTMFFVGAVTLVQSWWRILGAPGVVARIDMLPEIAPAAQAGNRTRHQHALAARAAIAGSLGLPLEDKRA